MSQSLNKERFHRQPLIALVVFSFLISFPFQLRAQDTVVSARPKLGLVLSGGGAKGFAHIGALRVFEEAGLQFDYVGGTSMGSIVGGLYAMGYHPDSMRKLVSRQNWNEVMNDRLPRKYIPVEEKTNADQFVVTFPFQKRKVNLKQGLISGQRIDMLLSRLTSPAYHLSDFNQLPLPFVCVATDLETGENVIIRKGQLNQAIRASMSIPSFFAPVEIDGRILIDGGVVNNYPVEEVRAMGADIIIGVDVQSALNNRDDLNSMVKILNQVASFYRVDAYYKGLEKTDIFIKPDLKPYEMMSFNSYDSIIARGEQAARQVFPQLKRLADSINALGNHKQIVFETKPLDSVLVGLVEYRGLKNVSRSFIDGTLAIEPGTWVKLDELENNIKYAYGSGFFESVSYSLQTYEGVGSRLVIEAREASSGALGAGINYNSDYKASVLLNATFKNVVFKGSKVFVDLNLGENPRISTLYLIDRGFSPGFGVRATLFKLKLNEYKHNKIIEVYSVVQSKAEAFMHIAYQNSLQFRTGAEIEYIKIETDIDPGQTIDYSPYLNFFASWEIDTYNRSFYPTKGVRLSAKVKYISAISENWTRDIFANSLMAFVKYNHNIPIFDKHTFRGGVNAGVTYKDNTPPPQHWFILGGQTQNNYFDGFLPFTGLHFVELAGNTTFSTKLAWQYQFYPKFYLMAKWDLGYVADMFEDLFEQPRLISGFGITAGYDSFIGPIELSLMGSNINNGMMNYINIGFMF